MPKLKRGRPRTPPLKAPTFPAADLIGRRTWPRPSPARLEGIVPRSPVVPPVRDGTKLALPAAVLALNS